MNLYGVFQHGWEKRKQVGVARLCFGRTLESSGTGAGAQGVHLLLPPCESARMVVSCRPLSHPVPTEEIVRLRAHLREMVHDKANTLRFVFLQTGG